MAREVLFSFSTDCSWIQHAARARKHRMLSEDQLSHWGREFIWVMLWGGGVEKLSALLYLQLKKSVLPGSNSRSLENEAHGIGDQEPSLQFRDGTVTYLLALAGKVFSVPCNILSPGISMKNLFLICCCSSSLHSHGYMAQHLWTAQGTHRVSCMSEPGHNFLLMAANSSDLLTKHGYSQGQRLGMRPTSTIGTAYFSITDCTVNLSLSRAVTGRDRAISRHHLKNRKQLEISATKTLTLYFPWI